MARNREKGQAILLVVVAMGIFMIGAVGLAVDGAQLYAQQQMAQVAADAAAQAGIMSIFDSTNTTAATPFSTSAAFTCSTTDGRTPCVYARHNGFGAPSTDTVTVDFPTSVPGVGGLSTVDPVNLIRVRVQRPVSAGLIRLLGAGATTTIQAYAIAAILEQNSPIPIIVTHPTKDAAFSTNGGTGGSTDTLKICGGPKRSIQVNSSSTTAADSSGGGHINLSHAGPDTGPADTDGCTGKGADFGSWGGPSTYANVDGGTNGKYISPASPILDPLRNVPQPTAPATPGPKTPIGATDTVRYGCPAGQTCTLYQPGLYSTGITIQNDIALFAPGLYYISAGGFNVNSNSQAQMATGFASDPNTGAGMVVFNSGSANGDIINFTSNAGSKGPITLLGSDSSSIYKGILFFQDRGAVAHNGVGSAKGHSIQGGGSITLTGTIYVTNTLATMKADATHYQALNIQGNAGSTTRITGEIIAGTLSVGGTAGILMTLSLDPDKIVRYIALVK